MKRDKDYTVVFYPKDQGTGQQHQDTSSGDGRKKEGGHESAEPRRSMRGITVWGLKSCVGALGYTKTVQGEELKNRWPAGGESVHNTRIQERGIGWCCLLGE